VVDVYIGIGSNINPLKNVKEVMTLLRNHFPSIKFSRIFESEAIGFEGDNFLNLVACFNSNEIRTKADVSAGSPKASQLSNLIEQLKNIENQMGRTRGSKKFSDRRIDIDVLLFGDFQQASPIELPRDEILENAYVLWPLSELAPKLEHPGTTKNYRELWHSFDKATQILKPLES